MSQISRRQWIIIITIMTTAILEVLDSTIVNVALPHMMASLGANQDQITWVLTSYIVASAVMLPLTGFLANRLGRRTLMLINISGFMTASALAGASHSLGIMVVVRLLQGAFGAALIPMSQAILRDTFSRKDQSKAMAIWGMGIMAAPVLGPTLGGIITEHANWRWIFYINIPICILALILTAIFITQSKRIKQKVDITGLILMVIGVGSLQYVLDQGNQKDWFSSNIILLFAVISLLGILLFLIRSFMNKPPLIKLSVFADRNFSLCTILLALFAGSVFSTLAIQPVMLEHLFNYPVITTGLVMSPMGLSSAVCMVIGSILMRRIQVKYLLTIAVMFAATASYLFSSYNLETSLNHFVIANMVMGAGLGFFMVPTSTYSLLTLPNQDISEGAGLFSYGRMLGTSIGISLISTLVSRETQINFHHLGGLITHFNRALPFWLAQHHLTLQDKTTPALLAQTVTAQANMQAFINAYHCILFVFILMIPFIWSLRHVEVKSTH